MPDIEFLTDTGEPVPFRPGTETGLEADAEPSRRGRWWWPATRAAGPACAAGAAALTLVACWRPIVVVSGADSGADGKPLSIDGWGRYSIGYVDGDHGTRFGVVLCVAAGLLVLAAVVAAVAGYRRLRRTAAAATGLLILALGVLGGVLSGAAVETQALLNRISIGNRDAAAQGQPRTAAEYGSLFWFGLSAGALTVVALVAPFVLRRWTDVPAPEVEQRPAPRERHRLVPHADDEVLDA